MNPRFCRSLVFAVGLALMPVLVPAAPAPNATVLKKAEDRFARTKAHIDNLLKRRLKPDPLPEILPNPFQLTGVAVAANPTQAVSTSAVESTPPGNDDEALARYAATLKISGTIRLNGRLELIINQSPYKEGDVIIIDHKDAVIYLQIIRLTPSELTLGFNNAVQVIKLAGVLGPPDLPHP